MPDKGFEYFTPSLFGKDSFMDETLTIELVKELDAKRDESVREVLCRGDRYEGPWPFFLDADCADQLPELAAKWGISLEILSKYRLLRDYINQTAQDCLDPESNPSPQELAKDLLINFGVFEPYFDREVRKVREALSDDDEFDDDFHRPWQQKLPLQILAPWEEEEDELADLQEDAGLQGD